MRVDLARPDITQKEIDAVVDVLKSNCLSIGPKIEEFESKIANYVGAKYAVGVNSGTSALHLIMKSYGIGEGDEVITTPYSFIASTSCILFENATPVFVDIKPDTLEMDIEKVEGKITPRTKAILVVDVFGHPCDLMAYRQLADKHGLILIEDSCEALGSSIDGIRCGSIADASVFAFYPNKQITTGEGGMIVTNNSNVAELCRSYRSQGRAITGFWLHHERIGYNYRLSEINAVIGSVQMDRLEEIIESRARVAQEYNDKLIGIKGVSVPYVDTRVDVMSWFVYVIRLEKGIDRNIFMESLKAKGVSCRPYFTPIHIQPFIVDAFGCKEDEYPISAKIGEQSVALPFYNNITIEEIEYVANSVEMAILEQG